MTETEMNVVLTTTETKGEAEKLSVMLIESRLAACVQEFPIHSRYRWEGGVQRDEEILILVKTSKAQTDKVVEAIKLNHRYDVPEIIVLPVTGGLDEYVNWVVEETAPS